MISIRELDKKNDSSEHSYCNEIIIPFGSDSGSLSTCTTFTFGSLYIALLCVFGIAPRKEAYHCKKIMRNIKGVPIICKVNAILEKQKCFTG